MGFWKENHRDEVPFSSEIIRDRKIKNKTKK
jgi:hypothetical protein